MTEEQAKYELMNRPQNVGALVSVESQRAIQEVQAAMIVAKNFPRDQEEAAKRIMKACERVSLAECAEYVYSRGTSTVEGPSIRLAEVIAQNWGNIDFGIKELSQANGESEIMAYCWDMETNVRQSKVFKTPHKRYTKNGSYALKDPRDIYEMVANQGARRVRACILGVVPGDIVEAARMKCKETLKRASQGKTVGDRVDAMLDKFKTYNVTQEMIEARLGHKVDGNTVKEQELVNLGKIYNSLRDEMSKPGDWFKGIEPETIEADHELTEKIRGLKTEPDNKPGVYPPPYTARNSEDFEKEETNGIMDRFIAEFINLKSAGYSTYIHNNLERLRGAPGNVLTAAREKWAKLYPDNPCPLDSDPDPDNVVLEGLKDDWRSCHSIDSTIAVQIINECGELETEDDYRGALKLFETMLDQKNGE